MYASEVYGTTHTGKLYLARSMCVCFYYHFDMMLFINVIYRVFNLTLIKIIHTYC